MMKLLGNHCSRITAYHPSANGLVEWFHRQLNAPLMAANSNSNWLEALPLVLLGIRSTVKEDLHCTPAELVYGTTLRLPGDFFQSPKLHNTIADPLSYMDRLRSAMRQLSAPPPQHQQSLKSHLPDALSSCSHVFIRHDAIKRFLQLPYTDPFSVVKRSPKYYTVTVNGRQQTVSIDRLKPAFFEDAELPLSCPTSPDTPPTRSTLSGRTARFPDRLTN